MGRRPRKDAISVIDSCKRNSLFTNRLATILLVQTKLLPPSALGVKDLKDKI